MREVAAGVLVALVAVMGSASRAQTPIPVMILDGESGGPYHDWARTTPVLESMLDETGRFAVTVVTAPPPGDDFEAFHPDFEKYRAVVLNYDAPDERWPDALKSSFERYVSGGGGVVAVHAADNAFPGWAAYNEMLGVGGWRGRTETAGPYWYYTDDRLVSDPSPGSAGSHGRRIPFNVTVRAPDHPIMAGLPQTWTHGADELYARLRGPGRNMTVLATAYSDPANAGSGRDEPQLMVLSFGQGRVFHTTWGHDVAALAAPAFKVTFQRGTEWAATGAVTLAPPSSTAAQGFPVSAALPPEARQFDFWIGEWNVNLRIRQDDGTWEDQVRSTARIYPILGGKAVLELWSDSREDGIKGFSLRYFDTARGEWVLWLNWPGPNRSGSSSLAGKFRHGRGEFFATRRGPDGTETTSRYTFSDITANSLRWDDAFSTDGGLTWRHGWIMEFSRTAAKPTLAEEGGPAHTFHEGERCDAPEFRKYEFLSGRKAGSVEAGGSGAVTITGHRVLDGCAVLTFAGPDGDPERAWGFSHVTWNTYAQRYELMTLTAAPDAPVRMFYSRDSSELVFYESTNGERPADRFRIERAPDGSVLWVHETPEGDGWRPVWQGRVKEQ